ncbi:hypothetical protein [Streptomyces atroolivaceus]
MRSEPAGQAASGWTIRPLDPLHFGKQVERHRPHPTAQENPQDEAL